MATFMSLIFNIPRPVCGFSQFNSRCHYNCVFCVQFHTFLHALIKYFSPLNMIKIVLFLFAEGIHYFSMDRNLTPFVFCTWPLFNIQGYFMYRIF